VKGPFGSHGGNASGQDGPVGHSEKETDMWGERVTKREFIEVITAQAPAGLDPGLVKEVLEAFIALKGQGGPEAMEWASNAAVETMMATIIEEQR